MMQKQTDTKPILSIAMCTYNGEPYLQEQLISIARQTCLPDELVVCDDCSIDATLQILDKFQKVAPFSVKIYRNETNLGPAKNFEKAIILCSGDVIVLSDQDDVWMPHKLERLKQLFEEHLEAGYIFSDALVTDETLHPVGCTNWEQFSFTGHTRRRFKQGHQLEIFLKRNVVTGATMAFRARLRDRVLPIPDTWMHDEWIAIIGSIIGKKGIFIAEPLIYYRQHPKQLMGFPKLKLGFNRLQQELYTKRKKYSYKRTKYLQLINRLVLLDIVTRDAKKLVEAKIRHLEARGELHKFSLLKRVKIVLRELIARRYHKFSKGWKGVMKDLFISINLADIKFLSIFKQFGKWLKFKALTKRIKIHGTLLYIHSTPAAIKEYIRQPFEPYTTELFKSAIKPGIVAVDIGAQFGYYSLLAAKFAGSEVQVFAFEPAPINFEILKKNIQVNNFTHIIHPIQKAIGDRSGTITLFLYKHSDSHGMFRHPRADVKETVSVECITIDEFLGGRQVDVMKMDIEGNEPYALEGMKQTISRSDSLILFTEFAPGFLRLAGVKPEDYLAQLKALGFDVKLIDEHSRCLKPVPKDFLAEDKPFGWYANLYCTKKR